MLRFMLGFLSLSIITTVNAQTSKPSATQAGPSKGFDLSTLPVSHAELGTFPYFRTLPNFTPRDSMTIEHNQTYFYDGKTLLAIDGKVSVQNQNVDNSKEKTPSIFQLIQEFDKMVATLGGRKVFQGQLPEDALKKLTGDDMVALASKHQVAPSAYYGVVEYVIKTPEKEVWLQLQPQSLGSQFYTLLLVEKESRLISTNINKKNQILLDLQKGGPAMTHLDFFPDSTALLDQSGDEVMNIVGVFQAHPDWKLKLDIHSAPVGKPEYTLALTQRRATAIQQLLISLGVKAGAIIVSGLGDQHALVPNESEKNRWHNTRVEIARL